MSVEYANDPENQQRTQQTSRWSHHLANDPYGGEAGAWAKQYYDNPNIDPGAAIQQQISGFRSQYGSAAPADDVGVMRMIATGQRPQAQVSTGQFPVQQYPQQLAMVNEQPRNDELFELLKSRATQGLNLDRNDPIIRAQADAFAANEDRSRRNYLGEVAERSGPYANLQGERRMTAEKVGQRTGSFEAELLGRELQAKRNEISQALSQWGGQLSDDQRLALQRELGLLDAALRQQALTIQQSSQQGQLDLGLAQLGLQSEQQNSYWDWIRRGGNLGG